ncbi:Small glutamine-rich tetratricopeptide repeat-containing protein beta [Linum perenne]
MGFFPLLLLLAGVSNDELFGQFFAALEKHHFFKATPDGKDDAIQLDKATRLFHDALNEMEKSGCQSYNSDTLAEALKSQGNRALQSKRYYDAVELYTCAIALSESKAIYYCNRAAAYTQVQKYAEAIRDCLKSIEIDPSYSKAYSRLGLVYYAQGNYRDAIDKGFKKALQLDPRNESIIENIQVAEKKLKEEQSWTQSSSSTSSGIPPFGSMPMPFDPSSLPANFANMMRNAVNPDQRQGGEASNHPPYQQQQPGVGGANINVNVEEMMPDELRGVLGSVMGMFTGATPPPPATTGGGNNGEQPSNGRSPAP